MDSSYIDGQLLKKFVINGCQNLGCHQEEIDALNVFPVPDGDTGSNMHMTIEGGAQAIKDSEETDIGAASKLIARAMTLSARGNSGVILSQFFKGLSLGLEGKNQVSPKEFCDAFISGVNQSYKVVKNPVEGTILTVMREASNKTASLMNENSSINEFFQYFLKEANESLERTPELLQCLKEAGVIDSGGAGYIKIIEGMAMVLDGNILSYVNTNGKTTNHINTSFNADSELEFGYCTEFILQLQNSKVDTKNFDIQTINSYLETIGNSIVSFKDEDVIKVHVHTMVPGQVLSQMQKYGEFVTVKIENMSVQHSENKENLPQPKQENIEHKKYAVVAVSSGEGISDIFRQLGADALVSGGQTMNPSAESFIEAFSSLDAENIFVFPNNSNIILTAKQAAKMYKKAKVYVVESKTIAECYGALSMLDYSCDDPQGIFDNFQEQASLITSGQITYSIRDSVINGINIEKGDYISIYNHNIVAASKSKIEAVMAFLNSVEGIEDMEVVTLIVGKDVSQEEQDEVVKQINEKYPRMEVGVIEGKQEVYSFIISL
ncbi:MAG: DAK2 domain-containing protein [Bacilli bacterium]